MLTCFPMSLPRCSPLHAGDQPRPRVDQDAADWERRYEGAGRGGHAGHREEGGGGEPSGHRRGKSKAMAVCAMCVCVCLGGGLLLVSWVTLCEQHSKRVALP